MRSQKVAIIGCGYIANGHLRSWKRTDNANVEAVVDLNIAAAKDTAERWKINNYFSSLDDLLNELQPDIVDICTPPQVHSSIAIQSIESGAHTLIEKPMTMTLDDAIKIVEAEKKADVKVGVIHNWLFEPPVPKARRLVGEGKLGEIMHVNLQTLNTSGDWMAKDGNHWCHKLTGGRFGEMLTHPIYLVKHFLGDVKLENILVSKIGDFPWMKSDELVANLSGGKRFGSFYASFNSPRQAILLEVYGQKALLSLDMINGLVSILPARDVSRFSVGFDSLKQATQIASSTLYNAGSVISGKWMTGHDLYIDLFIKALEKDMEPPVTVREGYEVVKILEEMINRVEQQEKDRSNSQARKHDAIFK